MPRKWTKKQEGAFLQHLRKTGNVSASIRFAGADRSSAYKKRKCDPEFKAKWQDSLSEATDALEGELRARALFGTSKPVFYGGKECGSVRSYNETLGMFLLKGRRPEIFGGSVPDEDEGNKQNEDQKIARNDLMKKLEAMVVTMEQTHSMATGSV